MFDFANEVKKYVLLTEDEEPVQGTEFSVVFYLPSLVQSTDDSMEEDNYMREIRVVAEDIGEAVKFAEQYIRKMQHDTSDWEDAEIQSIEQK